MIRVYPVLPVMLRLVPATLLLLSLLGSVREAVAQPLKGVVWHLPESIEQAEKDLRDMQRRGVEAVRTGLIQHEDLLTLADTLGLQLFQELPLDVMPAPRLADTLAYARRLLELALTQARNHPSARHFGLARHSDTSDPAACAFFEQLAERVHRLPGGQAYYVSAFVEDDQCAQAVDLVLLDALRTSEPAHLSVRYRRSHSASTRLGIGALGAPVRPNARPGLLVPGSSEAQARALETHLRAVLADTSAASLEAVFVYRWRDQPTPDLLNPAQPVPHLYGLYTRDGTPRPALRVVQGFFTGRQTTFAFPAGTPPAAPLPWAVLLGWLALLLLAACYGFSSRFRLMVPRYFRAHGFYREGIREGREVLFGVSLTLLLALALSVGVVGSVILNVVRHTPAFQVLFTTLPTPIQQMSITLLTQPWMLVLLLGSFYALGIALWTTVLTLASQRRRPLLPGQALMLVLWARWPMLLLLLCAMAIPSLPEALALQAVLILSGAWALLTLYAMARTLHDYVSITFVPGYFLLAIAFANPAMLILAGVALLLVDLGALRTFIWHLATRS